MAEVRPEDGGASTVREGDHQVARAAADIEHARAGAFENVAHAADGTAAPEAIEIAGEEMVGEIVAAGDAAEHAAHPGGRFLLAVRTGRGRAPHTRADRMASSTSRLSMPETTCTSPMRTGSTKCTL